jgi:nucleoside-diphosphate-sugar epimerase
MPADNVEGAGGFVGGCLLPVLQRAGWTVRTAGRRDVGDLGPDTDWRPLLAGADAVVHLAARVHVMRDTADDPDAAFDRANHQATAALAEQTKAAGGRRLVFLSSVKVHGDAAEGPLTADDAPTPADPYGRSKLAAEQALARFGDSMEIAVLRPPLVYGPGVKGNFLSMLKAVDRGWPLPLGAVENRRSLIYAGNLADAIRFSLRGPPGTYLPSDRDDVSTPTLLRRTAEALGKRARLLPVPVSMLRSAAALTGKSAAVNRLTGSLTVDGALPGWAPPASMKQGLAATAAWYRTR